MVRESKCLLFLEQSIYFKTMIQIQNCNAEFYLREAPVLMLRYM